MKTIPVNLASHIATRNTTLATALRVTREDGTVFGWTTHDVDDVVSGVTYYAAPGLQVTSVQVAGGAAVGNLELTTLHDGTVFNTVDLMNGVWRNAAFYLFRYNFASLSDGAEPLLAGTFGEFELRMNQIVIELRDLRQYLQQSVGAVSSKTCRYRLGDTLCGVVLTGSPNAFTASGFLTHVTSNRVFRDATRTEAADWFGYGEIEFATGANAGVRAKVKEYAADGTFTLEHALWGTVAVNDQYSAIAGCRKRREEDCRDKFDNVLNFGGEPDRKGVDNLTEAPAADV